MALLRVVAMVLLAPLLRPWFGDDSREVTLIGLLALMLVGLLVFGIYEILTTPTDAPAFSAEAIKNFPGYPR